MSIIIKSIKVVGEREGLVDFYGQAIVQTSNEETIVTVEYTTKPWITDNSVITAKRLQTLSNEQVLYYFEFSTVKMSNVPLHLKFRAQCNIANSSFGSNYGYEYIYNEGIPKEIIFHDIANECEKCRQYEEKLRSTIQEELNKECTICTEDIETKAFWKITNKCSHEISKFRARRPDATKY
ncbi:20514_t:CDS:2 [Racocetra persica]|uniref:20514_t:CDS:1 n=1 Tax=Racocetra persica TaxID=160502 RepID=A0ACA9LWV2_9GLOM|nr:20514_t:CDS:2 [Racocetra persica]